jgi:hypothetical protein
VVCEKNSEMRTQLFHTHTLLNTSQHNTTQHNTRKNKTIHVKTKQHT